MTTIEPVYDEWGVNEKWNNARAKGVKDEDIKKANDHAIYWYYTVGVNVIPSLSHKKRVYLIKYQLFNKQEMGEKLFNHLLDIGVFAFGVSVTTGKIWRGKYAGRYLNLIDYDNKKGENLMLTVGNNGVDRTLNDLAAKTIVETNKGSPDRGHIYIITERPMSPKEADGFEDKPKIEIYSGNHVSLAANSYKYEKIFDRNGKEIEIADYNKAVYRTEIMKTETELKQTEAFTRLPIYLNAEYTEELEKQINQKLEKCGLSYLNKNSSKGKKGKPDKTLDQMLSDNYNVYKGGNRQGALLRYIDKLQIYLKEKHITVSVDLLRQLAQEWNNRHCDPPVDENEFEAKLKESIKFIELKTGFIEGEEALIKELNELGINVENFMDDESLSYEVAELKKLITTHKPNIELIYVTLIIIITAENNSKIAKITRFSCGVVGCLISIY